MNKLRKIALSLLLTVLIIILYLINTTVFSNNHIQCAVSLVQDDKKDAAVNYLLEMTDDVSINFSHTFVIGNDAINCILVNKFSACKNNGIAFDYAITGDVAKIKDIDLSIIIGNLVDNAIEACCKCNDKRLYLKICNEKGYLKINVRNTIKQLVLSENPTLKTQKPDFERHGLGLKSVQSIAQRYNEFTDYYEKDNQFVASVLLRIN